MKFVLIFMMSVLVVTTHQYFHDQPNIWWSPYYSPAHPRHLNKQRQQPLLIYRPRPTIPMIQSSQDDNLNRNFLGLSDDSKEIENEQFVFPDTQSRVKGFNLDRLSHLNEQANGRFLFNLLSSSGTYTNPFFKTATFTSTLSVSLTSIVNCVPSNQMSNGAAATACNRKKRSVNDDDLLEENHFFIDPSETLKMTPTASSSSYDHHFHQLLSSSKNDEITTKLNSREKRFLFANKNQFIVSTTVTSVAFANTTVTVTRNLLNPLPPAAGCIPQAQPGTRPQCVACLPAGYIVCPAAG